MNVDATFCEIDRAVEARGRTSYASDLCSALTRDIWQARLPGVVVGLTDRDGPTCLAAFPSSTNGPGADVSTRSIFNIASMTKPLVATAAMQLVDEGRLALDEPISRYDLRAEAFQVLDGFDVAGRPRLRAPRRQVTLRHLLTHTSGLVYSLWNPEFERLSSLAGLPALESGEDAAFFPPLMFDPGERWEYGISIDWVGRLIEIVSGVGLGSVLRERLFEPLGMESTSFLLTPAAEARRARMHRREPDGGLAEVTWCGQPRPVLEHGGGGLYSTASDYMRFIRMLMNDGRLDGTEVLSAEATRLMATNAMGGHRVTRLPTTNPDRSREVDLLPSTPKSWSLGFMVNEAPLDTGRSEGSLAWSGLYNTHFWVDRQKGIGGVFLTQLLPWLDPFANDAFEAFERTAYSSISSSHGPDAGST